MFSWVCCRKIITVNTNIEATASSESNTSNDVPVDDSTKRNKKKVIIKKKIKRNLEKT